MKKKQTVLKKSEGKAYQTDLIIGKQVIAAILVIKR